MKLSILFFSVVILMGCMKSQSNPHIDKISKIFEINSNNLQILNEKIMAKGNDRGFNDATEVNYTIKVEMLKNYKCPLQLKKKLDLKGNVYQCDYEEFTENYNVNATLEFNDKGILVTYVYVSI